MAFDHDQQFPKNRAFTSRPHPSHPAHTCRRLSLFLTFTILLLGFVLFAQSSRSAAQGYHSQTRAVEQAGVTMTPHTPLQLAEQRNTTRTPRPTATPPVIPPPADPTSTNLMILLAAIIVAVILIGIWINRSRV